MRIITIVRLTTFALLLILLFVPPLYAQWEPDRRLTWNDSISYTCGIRPCLAAGSNGVMHLVWFDNRNGPPGNYEIYYKRSTDEGQSWDTADTRLTFDPGESYTSTISTSGLFVHVVWWDGRDGDFEIYYKRSTDGGLSWSSDVRLTYAPGVSRFPSPGVSGSVVHVVWEDARNGNSQIYYKRSTDDGATWDPDTCLARSTWGSYSPAIASQGDTVHVVWYDNRDKPYYPEIYYKRSTDSGRSWSPDTRLTLDSSNSLVPTISASGSMVHVAWSDERDGNGYPEVYYKRSSDGGQTWFPDVRLSALPCASSSSPIFASGNLVHVAWEDERDGNQEIYYKRSTDSGSNWSPDTRLTAALGNSHHPFLTVSNLVVHVVWNEERDGNPEVYYKRNPTGNGTEASQEQIKVQTLRFSPLPNPFTSFTRVPGHVGKAFSLFDISGRKVGVYPGDRIGWDVSPGIYFLRYDTRSAAPDTRILRIVKFR